MTPIFYRISHAVCFFYNYFVPRLTLLLNTLLQLQSSLKREALAGPRDVDILDWLGRTALELIGQGGLGHSFDPLTDSTPNEFGDALKTLVSVILYLKTSIYILQYRYF